MSDELALAVRISFTKGGASVTRAHNDSFDITGDAYTSNVQSVGTSEEELLQGAEVGTPGYVLAKNLDDTNYVEIGAATGEYCIKMKAGEFALWRHNSATLYAKANTAACLVEYTIIED